MNILQKHKISLFDQYVFLILIAFEIIMSFTFLGYIHIAPISVTFAYIPILIAACILGPVQLTVMGTIFGLASLCKSTAHYALPADMLFSPFLSGNAVGSLVLSVGSRTLFGLLAGFAFKAAKGKKHDRVWIGVVSLLSPAVHALLVLFAVKMFFPDAVHRYFYSPYLMVSNILSAVVCVAVMEFVWRQYNKKALQTVKSAVDRSKHIPYIDSGKKRILVSMFTVFVFGMTFAAALYFSERMSYMLKMHDVAVSSAINSDLIHLQVQFMAAMFSLNVISIVVLVMGYQYASYKKFLGELDVVTGVMGRRIFLNCCERTMKRYDSQTCTRGWFLFLDVDNFKTINDTLGHTAGDNVLREIALCLKSMFYDYGIVGRMGGDEFAVMLDKKALSEDELTKLLNRFLSEIAEVLPAPHKVSCSIGVCCFSFPADISSLMNKTDVFLYQAKQNGRARYALGDYNNIS